MTPADKIAAAETRRRFAQAVSKQDAALDLARAALLIGAEEEPAKCDFVRCLSALEWMGREASERARHGPGSSVEALNRYLFEEQGFKGNQSDYYDPRNSMLHRVLERRTGIPITLSIIYMEVGRRAGLRVEGIGMPGHFIVRASTAGGVGELVDPFNGRMIGLDDCQERLDTIYGGQVVLSEESLRPVGHRAIMTRVLGNLKAVYMQAKHYRRVLAAIERILLINPHAHEERRDRGLLLAQLDRLPEAITDTQSYLSSSPDAADAENIREQLNKMQARQALLN